MKPRSLLISWVGILLFLTGAVLGMSLSGAVVWGEVESRVYSGYSGERGMKLTCPLMLSPAESGKVSAEIINLTEKEIKPIVNVEFGRTNASQTFILAPMKSQPAQWTVTSSAAIFDNLIVANVLQSQYRNNPSRSGSCGILLFSLFELAGMQTFYLIFGSSIASLLIGGGLWFYLRSPLDNSATNIAQAGGWLAGMIIAAMLLSIRRWWGLTLLLDAASLLLIGVIFVEFILFPKKDN